MQLTTGLNKFLESGSLPFRSLKGEGRPPLTFLMPPVPVITEEEGSTVSKTVYIYYSGSDDEKYLKCVTDITIYQSRKSFKFWNLKVLKFVWQNVQHIWSSMSICLLHCKVRNTCLGCLWIPLPRDITQNYALRSYNAQLCAWGLEQEGMW